MIIPIFVEVPDKPEIAICAPVTQMLLEQGIQPVGLATSVEELESILQQLKENSLEPGIFIVNTFLAKPIIPELDRLMGEAPVVFLRRSLYAGQSGLMDFLAVTPDGKQSTLHAIQKLRPRLTSIWQYGSKNADQVRQRVLKCMLRYLNDKDFKHFEIENKTSSGN